MTRRFDIIVIACVCMACGAPGLARAERALDRSRLRLTDAPLQAIVAMGRDSAPSFRALIDRLPSTDVVVYVQCARLRPQIDGQLTFIGAAGGVRYLLVQIAWQITAYRKVAVLGHELQHALEIAERPEIVDRATLAHAYERFGLMRRSLSGVDFDTAAAIQAGDLITRELAGRADGD